MPNPIISAVGGIVGSVISGNKQKQAAETAADSQLEASQMQLQATEMEIEERRRQFDKIQELLAPYVTGGTDAFSGALNLAGVNGAGAQRQAITGIEQSPEFEALYGSAENALLQNASATGGLRGGNTQDALSRVRPEILRQLVNEQYGRLGGLATVGQNAAAQTGTAAQNLASGIGGALQQQGQIFGQQGAIGAGAALAQGQAAQNTIGGIGRSLGGLATSWQDRPADAGFFDSWGF